MENMPNFIVSSIVPADALAPWGAKAYAGRKITKFRSRLYDQDWLFKLKS